jgi:hypothetical protein
MSVEPASRVAPARGAGEKPPRPWAYGIGLLILGLIIAAIGNAIGMHGPPGSQYRMVAAVIYPFGLLVSGTGMHRLIWWGPSRKPGWLRLLITAAATVPAFALAGILLSFMFLLAYLRFQ